MQNFKFTYDYSNLSEMTKWTLTHTTFDPKIIATVYGYDENELWAYIIDLNINLREAEKERKENAPALQKEIQEFRNEFTPDFRKELRRDYLQTQLEFLRKEFNDGCVEYALDKKKGNPVSSEHLEGMEKAIAKIMYELKIIRGFEEGISQFDIERAKEFPIENIIEVKRNYALCPFHNEKTPSMYVKNNIYHCFGCSEHGDVIDMHMKLNNTDFISAVKALQ